jgi:hypothetical protein
MDTPTASVHSQQNNDAMSVHTSNTAPVQLQTTHQSSLLANYQQQDNLSVQQMAERLERQRMTELKNAAIVMKGTLVQNGRCPKCTLKPPCKHFETSEDIPKEAPALPSLLPAVQTGLGKMRNESDASRFTTSSSVTHVPFQALSTLQTSGAQVLQKSIKSPLAELPPQVLEQLAPK